MKRVVMAALAAWVAIVFVGLAAAEDKDQAKPPAEPAAATPAAKDTATTSTGANATKPSDKVAAKAGKPAAKSAAKSSAKSSDKNAAKTPAMVDSLALLEKAVARDSSKFDALYRLGTMYLDRDRIPEATRVLARANKIKPKDVPVLVNLGAAADAGGNSEGAQRYYREALTLAPEDSIATCRLASSLYAQSKYTEAIELLRGVIASKPRSHCAYFTLGVAFADAGIYRDAIRMWKKVVELAPQSPEAASANESIDVLEKFMKSQ